MHPYNPETRSLARLSTTGDSSTRSLSTAFSSSSTNRYVIIALAALSFALLATVIGLLGWISILKKRHRSRAGMMDVASPMQTLRKSIQQSTSQSTSFPMRRSLPGSVSHLHHPRSLKDAPFPITSCTPKEISPFTNARTKSKGRRKIRPSLVIDLDLPLKRTSLSLPRAPWTSPLPPETSSSSDTVFRPYRTTRAASYPPDTRSPLGTPNSQSLLLEQRSSCDTPTSKIVSVPRRPQTAPTTIVVTDTEASTSDFTGSPPFGLDSPPLNKTAGVLGSPPLSDVVSNSSHSHRPTTAGSGRPTTAGSNAFSIISGTSWSSARYSNLFFTPRAAPPGPHDVISEHPATP